MKRLLFFAIITILCAISGLSQQNFQRPKYSNNSGSSYSSVNSAAVMYGMYAEVIKQNEKLHINPERFQKMRPDLLPGYSQHPRPDDHMPILKPKGYFHGIVIRPDSTIDYKLIIKKP